MTWGEVGQLMGGVGLLVTALCAGITLTVISLKQTRKQWVDDFRVLYAEFWKDTDVSHVRKWIISDTLYDEVLKPVLMKRNQANNALNEAESAILDNIDKFIAVIIRLDTFENTRMTKHQRDQIERLLFTKFWKTAAVSRQELNTYMKQDWGGEIKLPTHGDPCNGAMMEKRKMTAYRGPAIFGVPFLKEDRVKAIDALLEYFIEDSNYMEACSRVIDYNEKIVARCGVLLTFNSILLVLITYAASPQLLTSSNWYKGIFYVTIVVWALSNARLIFAIRHVFPKPHEFVKENDFRQTADLYITRMAIYNVTLLLSLLAFLIITSVALFNFVQIG